MNPVPPAISFGSRISLSADRRLFRALAHRAALWRRRRLMIMPPVGANNHLACSSSWSIMSAFNPT
jgi:hypothetical protein